MGVVLGTNQEFVLLTVNSSGAVFHGTSGTRNVLVHELPLSDRDGVPVSGCLLFNSLL